MIDFYVVAAFIISTFLVYWWGVDKYALERGQFGDKFGGLNALFSGLALAGVVWSLIQQQKTLELQRDDLKTQQKMLDAQLEEMKDSTVAQNQMARAQQKQTELLTQQFKFTIDQMKREQSLSIQPKLILGQGNVT